MSNLHHNSTTILGAIVSKPHDTFYIRCRGIIMYEGKILLVKHDPAYDYFALPGGHMDFGEDPVTCIKREMEEELGIECEVGKLLYVNNFVDDKKHSVELFFEITNGEDYADLEEIKSLQRSHDFEIEEVRWIGKSENIDLRPDYIWKDFKNGDFDKSNIKDWQTRIKHSTRQEYNQKQNSPKS